jgi:tRNA(fMet)-specific endonuclease VapC
LLLEDIHVAAFNAKSAAAYGLIRFSTKDKKRDSLGKLIAAHAVALGVVLVTNNESDFFNYLDLKVENWVASH